MRLLRKKTLARALVAVALTLGLARVVNMPTASAYSVSEEKANDFATAQARATETSKSLGVSSFEEGLKYQIPANSRLYKHVFKELWDHSNSRQLLQDAGVKVYRPIVVSGTANSNMLVDWEKAPTPGIFIHSKQDTWHYAVEGIVGGTDILVPERYDADVDYILFNQYMNLYGISYIARDYARNISAWGTDEPDEIRKIAYKRAAPLMAAASFTGQGDPATIYTTVLSQTYAEYMDGENVATRRLSCMMAEYNEMPYLSFGSHFAVFRVSAEYERAINSYNSRFMEGLNSAFGLYDLTDSLLKKNGKNKVEMKGDVHDPHLFIDGKEMKSYDQSNEKDGPAALIRSMYVYGKVAQAIHNGTWDKESVKVGSAYDLLDIGDPEKSHDFYDKVVVLYTTMHKNDSTPLIIDKFYIPQQYRDSDGAWMKGVTVPSTDTSEYAVDARKDQARLVDLLSVVPEKAY